MTVHTAMPDLTTQAWSLDVPDFVQPFIDADEMRDTPVAHRFVHGGFEGTDTRFSFYLPSSDQYEGRFFQHVTPVPQSENSRSTRPVRRTRSPSPSRAVRISSRRTAAGPMPRTVLGNGPDHRRVPCQRGGCGVLPPGGTRGLRRAPDVRLSVRRKRRRIPHHRRGREHARGVGRIRSLRDRQPDGRSQRVRRPYARAARSPRRLRSDRGCLRRGETRLRWNSPQNSGRRSTR